jgi:hypothetical protein
VCYCLHFITDRNGIGDGSDEVSEEKPFRCIH